MTLNRVYIPSPNYSSRGGQAVRLLVVHTAEGALTYQSLGSFFANPGSGVSSHVGIDDTHNTAGEYVARANKAWTQANANPVAAAAELCAFAAWSAAEWDDHSEMLDNLVRWLREESAAFGVPIVKLTPAQAQGSSAGVCAHSDLGAWGGNHSDPGPNFPWERVIEQAGGAPPPTQPPPGGAGAPPFPGTLLINYTEGHGTATWQRRMSERGWTITVDDAYGIQSSGVCTQFQREKGLAVDGIVGPETWAAAWTAPIT